MVSGWIPTMKIRPTTSNARRKYLMRPVSSMFFSFRFRLWNETAGPVPSNGSEAPGQHTKDSPSLGSDWLVACSSPSREVGQGSLSLQDWRDSVRLVGHSEAIHLAGLSAYWRSALAGHEIGRA